VFERSEKVGSKRACSEHFQVTKLVTCRIQNKVSGVMGCGAERALMKTVGCPRVKYGADAESRTNSDTPSDMPRSLCVVYGMVFYG
jgi:hypothetical protein